MQHQQYAEERGLLGLLCPGQKKLEGKTFYLDSVKKRSTTLLLEAISLLGGHVESFLHKDVSFVVTGNLECLQEKKHRDTKAGSRGTSEETQHPIMTQGSVLSSDKRRPGAPRPIACGSRGKALLEKAIRNNEQLQRGSVLTNARSWGVKILYVEDVLLYLKQLTQESFRLAHKKPERTYTKQQGSNTVKAATLRSPYLKIEDRSRKYKPLQMQSMTFPTLCYSGRFSPFESPPPPPQFDKWKDQGETKPREKKKPKNSIQEKSQELLSGNPSPWRPHKKDLSYCECCHQPFSNMEEHLQSDQHRAFVLDLSNYIAVDQLVAEMLPGFNPDPPQQSEETPNLPPTPLLIHDVCELEPLTDAETEHAVKALQRQGSPFSAHLSSPTRDPLASHPASPAPEVQIPIPNPATPPADIQLFSTNTDSQIPDGHPRSSSPAMPVLDVEPKVHDSASQQPDTDHFSPCPDMPCPFPNPYSLPPVLSPQVPCSSYSMDPHSPYSQPPVLSPQWFSAVEDVEGDTCEMDTAGSVLQSVPAVAISVSNPLLSPEALNAEGVKESNKDSLIGLSGIMCPTSGLDCTTLFSRRSRSLPRPSTTAPNPKKRCRSASPENSQSKRRRITLKFNHSSSWDEQRHKSAKPESDIMGKSVDYLLSSDRVSCQPLEFKPNTLSSCVLKTLDFKQTSNMFCVPTVQNFSQSPNHNLGHGSTPVADKPSWPLSPKAETFDPLLQSPNNKSHSTYSSQDFQCSVSHSTSVSIESALIPDLAALSPSSSDSDWDCDLLSQLGSTSVTPLPPTEQSCELDKELLHRPCTWMHDTSYESRLRTVLQPSTPPTPLCGEEMDPSAFSRTVVQIVEVQH